MIQKRPCPVCRARGLDTTGDNLVLYEDDGHQYCYSCGYYLPGTLRARLSGPKVEAPVNLNFPDDYSQYMPRIALTYLAKYGITQSEVRANNIGWSESQQLLIYPVFGVDKQLIMWQGRNFKIADGTKFITKGKASEILHIIKSDTIPEHMSNT